MKTGQSSMQELLSVLAVLQDMHLWDTHMKILDIVEELRLYRITVL